MILPYWQQFMTQQPKNGTRDIKDFIHRMADLPEIQDETRRIRPPVEETAEISDTPIPDTETP